MTKKRSSENLADENQKLYLEKVKLGKFSTNMRNFGEIGGNLKQGEIRHCLKGDGRPCHLVSTGISFILPIANYTSLVLTTAMNPTNFFCISSCAVCSVWV